MAQNAQINLGRVTGKSAYEEWLLQDGNEGKSFDAFLEDISGPQGSPGPTGPAPTMEEITDAFQLVVDASPNENEGSDARTVSSEGIYKAFFEGFGAQDDVLEGSLRFVTSGAVARKIKELSPISSSASFESISSSYTLEVPSSGGAFYYLATAESAKLTFRLPSSASEGTSASCLFSLNTSEISSGAQIDVVVSEGGILLMEGTTEVDNAYAFVVEGIFRSGAWFVNVHSYLPKTGVEIRRLATILYSGANRSLTESSSVAEAINLLTENTFSTDAFGALYGVAPLSGWTTDINGSDVEYGLGATIPEGIVEEGQTLTLYPVYTETAITANKTVINNATANGNGAYTTGTATILPEVSGGYQEDTVSFKVYWTVYNANQDNSTVAYKIGSGSYTTIASNSSKGTYTGELWINNATAGATLTVRVGGSSTVRTTVKITSYKIG